MRFLDEKEKSKFTNILTEEAAKGWSERHLWISLFERPARNRFTRVQRATVCITVLFVFMFLNAMWYGLLHTADENDDGVVTSQYLQWLDVLIGIVSALITFPVAVLLIQLFKHIQPARKVAPRPGSAQSIEMDVYPGALLSRSTSASTSAAGGHPRRYGGIMRLPSNMSNDSWLSSEPNCNAGALRRTGNFHVKPAKSASSDISSTQVSRVTVLPTCNIVQCCPCTEN